MAEQFLTLMADLDDEAQAGSLPVRRAAAVSVDAPRHHPDRRTGNSPCGHAGFLESICTVCCQDHPVASVRILADAGDRIIYTGREKVR